MHWLQNRNQSNLDHLNNARREASRHFKNKKEGIPESQTKKRGMEGTDWIDLAQNRDR